MRVRDIIGEPLEVQYKTLSRKNIQERVEQILQLVGLGTRSLNLYPHEFSGGQKQRIAIARAIILEPSLVILDEPVSALDVSVRAQILNLLADIQEKQKLTYLIVAHDLAMLQHVTSQIAVMYLGKILEMGDTEKVFTDPLHPYTKALFAAVPRPEPDRIKEKAAIAGEIGDPIDPPSGCRFHPRCKYAIDSCSEFDIPLKEIKPRHWVACHRIDI